MEENQKRAAPYLPFSTFISGIEALQAGVPEVLDKSMWRSLSGTAQNQIMGALRYFEFIDDERRVQPALKALVHDKENRKAHIRELLERFYPELVSLGRNTGTMPQLNTTMERYGVRGGTVPKAVAFFLKAAEYAELSRSPHWKDVTRKRNGSGPRAGRSAPRKSNSWEQTENGGPSQEKSRNPQTEHERPTGETRTFKLSGGDQLSITLSRSFISLPLQDRRWFAWLVEHLEAYESGDLRDIEHQSVTPRHAGTALEGDGIGGSGAGEAAGARPP